MDADKIMLCIFITVYCVLDIQSNVSHNHRVKSIVIHLDTHNKHLLVDRSLIVIVYGGCDVD